MSVLIPVFLVRLAATAVLIISVVRVAERAGPFLASTILTLPLFAGPSYFFLMFDVSGAFIAESALYAFAGTGAVLAFTTGFILAVRRVGLLPSLIAGTAGWAVLALPMHVLGIEPWSAWLACALGVAVAYCLRRPLDLHGTPGVTAARWRSLILRALVAGAAVAAVSAFGKLLGPRLTGILVTFPLTLTVSTWMVYRHHGPEFAAAVLAATQRTLPSYASFCLLLSLLADRMDVRVAFASALLGSVICAIALATYGVRAQRAARA
jgi:uncharacterized membrane protein (GlpM family)